MHETHIVFENLLNINGDMLQKAWGLKIGEDGSNKEKGAKRSSDEEGATRRKEQGGRSLAYLSVHEKNEKSFKKNIVLFS